MIVSAAEAVGRNGLEMAELSSKTKKELSSYIPPTGTSLANPVDVSLTAHLDLNIFFQAVGLVAADPAVDLLVIIGSGMEENSNNKYIEGMIQAQKTHQKPFLMVAIPGMSLKAGQSFCRAGIPFFDTAEKAVKAYSKVVEYYSRWK